MADPILKRLYEYPLASIFNGVFAQDKVGGITESVGPDQVFAALDAEGFARDIDLPAPSSEMPQDLGTASSGSGEDYSRADHRHKKPSLADLGAAAASHTHATSQVTGLDTALAAKEPSLGNPGGTTPLWLRTIAGVRSWVQLVAADITDLGTTLAAYLTKSNPNFIGSLSQAGVTRIASNGDAILHAGTVRGNGSDTVGAGPYWQVDNYPTSPAMAWLHQLGADNGEVVFHSNNGVWSEKWRYLSDGSLKQAGSVRITSGGGFRGVDLKLTGLVAGAGKMTRIGADGLIEAATNPDPNGSANIGGNAGTINSGAFYGVLQGPQIVGADWVDGSSYELKGVVKSASGGYFDLRLSVGSFTTPALSIAAGSVYADVVVRVIVTGTDVQVTYRVISATAAGVTTTKVGTATGAYGAGPQYAIVVQVQPEVSQTFTTANIMQRRTT